MHQGSSQPVWADLAMEHNQTATYGTFAAQGTGIANQIASVAPTGLAAENNGRILLKLGPDEVG